MNIRDAKEFIKNTVSIYLAKDRFGEYRIPIMNQRPIFLLGAPGIGKTAIMEQIAEELDLALVSYSMTHHTRQSALGLPFISEKNYGGKDYSVSEYTMSEILATVDDTMDRSGHKEGILFLDEINCVSETLYPSMLQFLQYKTFGRHSVPDGWVVVTAGNPPSFNRSVREFDVVTLDRLKVLEIDPDYGAWKEYASDHGVHPAIIGFLENNKDYFYKIETTVSGKKYVTARGWEDLSTMLLLYEEKGLPVSDALIVQYITQTEIVSEFYAYYELYNTYKQIYQIGKVLEGDSDPALDEKIRSAQVDERLMLTSVLTDTVKAKLAVTLERYDDLAAIKSVLARLQDSKDPLEEITGEIDRRRAAMEKMSASATLTYEGKLKYNRIHSILTELSDLIRESGTFESAKERYGTMIGGLKEEVMLREQMLKFLFDFLKSQFGEESNELLLAVTELTYHTACTRFFSIFGSGQYEQHAKLLSVKDSKEELRRSIDQLNL